MVKCLTAIAILFLMGCSSNYYKSIDGTSTILGISLPDEQYIQINALSYLGGGKTVVREPASIVHEYETRSTNDYFGIVHTREWRRAKITVFPTNTVNSIEAGNGK